MASLAAWKRKMALTGNVLISQNISRNIQDNSEVLYSCGTDRAVVCEISDGRT